MQARFEDSLSSKVINSGIPIVASRIKQIFYSPAAQLPTKGLKTIQNWTSFLLSWIVIATFLAGCTQIKLISDYDENIDIGITNIQKKVEAILTKIEKSASNPSSTYVASDYSSIKEDLNVLITRAESTDKNELTTKQLYTLGYALLENPTIAPENLKMKPPIKNLSLEKRHQLKEPFQAEDIRDLRSLIGVNFRAILKFELDKKRGASTGTNSN